MLVNEPIISKKGEKVYWFLKLERYMYRHRFLFLYIHYINSLYFMLISKLVLHSVYNVQ